MPPSPEVIDAIGRLLSPLLERSSGGLGAASFLSAHAPKLAETSLPARRAGGAAARFEALAWPETFTSSGAPRRRHAADLELVSGFVDAAKSPDDLLGLYRALRRFARIQETL